MPSERGTTLAALEAINTKLDVLVREPFLSAVEHYQNRAMSLCYESLVKATRDRLDAPARLMYIHLLRTGDLPFPGDRKAQLRTALLKSFEFLEDFGFRADDIAPEAFEDWVNDLSDLAQLPPTPD